MLPRPCCFSPRRWNYVLVSKILILLTKTSTRETNLFQIYSYYNFLLVVFLEIFHLIFKISFMCFLLMVLLIFWWIWFFTISYYWFCVLTIFFLTSSSILSLSSAVVVSTFIMQFSIIIFQYAFLMILSPPD